MASSSAAASIPVVIGEPVCEHIVQGVPVQTSHDDANPNGLLLDGSSKHALVGLRRCKLALEAVVKGLALKQQAVVNDEVLAKREAEARRKADAKEATLARRKAKAECKAEAKEATRARRKAEAALKAAAKEAALKAEAQRKAEAERIAAAREKEAQAQLEREQKARAVRDREQRKQQQQREEQRRERQREWKQRQERAAELDRMYGKVENGQRPGLRRQYEEVHMPGVTYKRYLDGRP
jgi:hypothetical protein